MLADQSDCRSEQGLAGTAAARSDGRGILDSGHSLIVTNRSVCVKSIAHERIRPLNDLLYRGAARRAEVEPRLTAFLAYLAAIGLLTLKGMVESLDDPLLYSDEQLVEGFARIFAAAAAP